MPDNPSPSPPPRGDPETSRRPAAPSLGAQLVVLGADLSQLFERFTRRHGVSLVDANVLSLLGAHDPTPLEPWQVGQVLGLQSNHLAMVFDRLAGLALVDRTVHPADRRRRLVRLTEAGAQTSMLITAGLAQIERQVMDAALTEDDQRRLAELCTALRNGLRETVIPTGRTRPGP
jgi:DNA-binding MarR family transcriptional regulator